MVLGKLRALGLYGVGVGEEKLCSWGYQFVSYAVARHWVLDILIHDFEDAVESGFGLPMRPSRRVFCALRSSFLEGWFLGSWELHETLR